jgi:hypothetical protein
VKILPENMNQINRVEKNITKELYGIDNKDDFTKDIEQIVNSYQKWNSIM